MAIEVVLILHLLISFSAFIMIKKKVFCINSLIFPTVILIPFWGFAALCIEELLTRKQLLGTKTIEIDKMKQLDKKFRHIDIETNDNQKLTVPLEEAIQINDSKTRRSLMLDILHKNPGEYLDMLQRTRLSSDVELTHFATTTIMEIQSDYEHQVQKYDSLIKQKPDDEKVIANYLTVLLDYINSGLLTGNILLIQRVQLKNLLEKMSAIYPYDKNWYLLQIENDLELEQYNEVYEMLITAKKRWPEEEKVYMLFVNYYRNTGQGQEIPVILNEIENNNIYLSGEGKEWFNFWNKGT